MRSVTLHFLKELQPPHKGWVGLGWAAQPR